MSDTKLYRHKIGSTRTIQTAVLACEYLKKQCSTECKIHAGSITYVFIDPTPENGWWSADIIVTSNSPDVPGLKESSILVDTLRAFVAGRGEVWA